LGHPTLDILNAHGAKLYTLLHRLTLRHDVADDLLQELFVKLLSSHQLSQVADPVAYAYRCAINLAMDYRRSQVRQPRLDTSTDIDKNIEPSPLESILEREQIDRILNAVALLPELQRRAFVLRYVQEQSYQDIGAALGHTAHQARAMTHAAVRQVRISLNADAQQCPESEVCNARHD
jgi:RNA polymerase sigma-70 factor (ECF subfamily)